MAKKKANSVSEQKLTEFRDHAKDAHRSIDDEEVFGSKPGRTEDNELAARLRSVKWFLLVE